MKFKLLILLSFFHGLFLPVSFVNAQGCFLFVPRKWSSSDAIDEKPKWHRRYPDAESTKK